MKQANRPLKPKSRKAELRHQGRKAYIDWTNKLYATLAEMDLEIGKAEWLELPPDDWLAEFVIRLLDRHPHLLSYIREWRPDLLSGMASGNATRVSPAPNQTDSPAQGLDK